MVAPLDQLMKPTSTTAAERVSPLITSPATPMSKPAPMPAMPMCLASKSMSSIYPSALLSNDKPSKELSKSASTSNDAVPWQPISCVGSGWLQSKSAGRFSMSMFTIASLTFRLMLPIPNNPLSLPPMVNRLAI